MSLIMKTTKQSSLYVIFQVVGLGVSFVSFPIMTRMFSVEEYGNLALVNATLGIVLAFAKSGIATSFIKQYPEYTANGQSDNLISSAFGGVIFVSLSIIIVYSVVIFSLRTYLGNLLMLFMIVGAAILIRNLANLFAGFLRATEKVLTLNAINLVTKIGSISAGISICFFLAKGLYGYFIGALLFEAVMIIGLAVYFYKKNILMIKSFSLDAVKKLYLFGLPLIVFETSSLINDYADRFLIKYFLGSAQLGVYSVGYNMSMYAQSLITAPLWMSVFPIYTKLWATEGQKETEFYLSQLLKYYICISIIIVLMVSLLSEDIITILASKKYEAAASIVPFVIGSIMINGTYHITGAGFMLLKKTKYLAVYTVMSAILNILLNILLIPRYNIMGAAYSTVISYSVLTILITVKSNTLLKIKWPIRDIALFLIVAGIVAMVLIQFNFQNKIIDCVTKLFLGFSIYSSFFLIYYKKVDIKKIKAIVSNK